MRSREQVIWDFVHAWLAKADRDLRAAEALLPQAPQFADIIAFHCQQASEKFFKGLLVRHQVEFPKTHDLAALRALIAALDPHLADDLTFAEWLSPFGVEARYPTTAEVSDTTAASAHADAARVRQIIFQALEEYLRAGRP